MRLIAALFLLLLSCGGPRIFVNPEADLLYYKKIGVLPFKDISGSREAGEKVSLIFYTELMLQGKFDIVDPGELRKRLREISETQNIPEDLGLAEIKKLGNLTGAQGIIEGVVVEYTTIRSGGESYPLITLNVRLIDTQYGKVVWEITHTKSGRSKIPILGIGGTATLPELTRKVCHDVVKEIMKRMK
jgi:curli biogenesis system outer membrane secretion channel CsgG